MKPALLVIGCWSLFALTHFSLSLPPLRDLLVGRFGEPRFIAFFSGVASLLLGLLAMLITEVGATGAPGPMAGAAPVTRALLALFSVLGLSLASAGLLNYMRSPMAIFRTKLHPPQGIERITRHGFFIGLAMFASAHALLSATLVLCMYFTGFATMAVVGAWVQDRKLLRRHGDAYAQYMRQTSLLPFAAVLQGRQVLPRGERLPRKFVISVLIALLLAAIHPLWSLWNGALLAGIIAAGGLLASLRRWRHASRQIPAAGDASIAPENGAAG